MKKLRRITPRRVRFVHAFVANGGNATAAALAVGYSPAGARVTGSLLLNDDWVLAAIVAEISRGAPGADAVLRRLLLPSRPAADRLRVEVLLQRGRASLGLIGSPDHPRAIIDPVEVAERDQVVRLAGELGVSVRASGTKARYRNASRSPNTQTNIDVLPAAEPVHSCGSAKK